jgi:transcriptional regulator with XRE-family HTH domain
MILGKRIEEAISQSEYTTQEIALYVGVSYAKLLSFYKLDSIELKYLRKIAQKLNLPLSYFLAELTPSFPSEQKSTPIPNGLHVVKQNIQVLHRQLDICHAEMERLKKELSKTVEQLSFVIKENNINILLMAYLLS